MTKILDERYKQIVDDEILNIFNTLSTSINAKANSSDVYTKLKTDEQIRLKVAEIVAGAPSDFDTLKEISDWLNTHAESAAAMNVQIQDNASDIAKLQSEIQSQSTTIGTHENKISVLTNNVSSLSTGLSAATQNISNAQADIDNNSDDISALKERVSINKTTLGYQKKNLCPVNSKTMSANGWVMGGGTDVYKVYIPKGKYILTFKQTAIGQSEVQFFNSTNTQITRVLPYASTENSSLKFTITLSEDCYGMKFYNNSGVNTYSNIMIRDAAITDTTFEPYVESVDERLNTNETEIALNKTTLGYQKKNLFNLTNPVRSTTMGGITFTVNADKTITLNGTATTTPWFELKGNLNIQNKNLGGCKYSTGLTENADSGCYVNISYYDANWSHQTNQIASNNDAVLNGNYTYATHSIVVTKGTTLNNVIVKPMVRLPDITDTTFEPYVESVDERLQLLEVSPTINDVQIKGDIDSVNDLKIAGKCVGPDHGEIFNSYNNTATGIHAHAEGVNTHAEGDFSHAEGHSTSTTANGAYSHVQGEGTRADSFHCFVTGKWNIIDSNNKYAFIIGNGTSDSSRSNAFAIDWYGNMYIGDSTVGINLLTSQSQLYSNTTGGSSPLTITVSNLFAEYSTVICNVVTSSGRYSLMLPLRYIKSLGTSAYYEAEGLLFYYVDDSNLKIYTGLGQSNPTINSIKLIGLY